MSQKTEKPVLSGQRIKTRKRDEKEKYDPTSFGDAVLQGLQGAEDLEQVSKFLDGAGNNLNYRRYGEPLFDILFAGGILAPGGTLLSEASDTAASPTKLCVFSAEKDFNKIKAHYEVFYLLIRRYKYLEKSFEEELIKLVVFLKGFSADEREKLATVFGICFGNGLGTATCLNNLLEEHLVRDGIALSFATDLFRAWLKEKDINNVSTGLKRAGLEGKLMHLLPINKRTVENFDRHFKQAGLHQVVEYQRVKTSGMLKKSLQTAILDMIKDEEPVKEIITRVKEDITKNNMVQHEVVVLVWNTLMSAVEWNKKDELVADQALKHLQKYTSLLAALTTTPRDEMALIVKVQEFCYDNMNFNKVFQKIVFLFYKTDVLSEDSILAWYKESHTQKGKGIFLEQMAKFVKWLQDAEEESEEEDD